MLRAPTLILMNLARCFLKTLYVSVIGASIISLYLEFTWVHFCLAPKTYTRTVYGIILAYCEANDFTIVWKYTYFYRTYDRYTG